VRKKKHKKGGGHCSHTIPLFKLFPGRPRRTFSWTWAFLGGILLDSFSCWSRSDRKEVGGGGRWKGGSGRREGARWKQDQLRIDRRYEGRKGRWSGETWWRVSTIVVDNVNWVRNKERTEGVAWYDRKDDEVQHAIEVFCPTSVTAHVKHKPCPWRLCCCICLFYL
jgi:hypothetical protein